MDLNIFDWVVIALVVLLALKGLVNGLIRELFGLIGIIGGVFLASKFSAPAGMWISQNIYTFKNEAAINLVGFFILLAGIWLIAMFIGELLQKLVRLNEMLGVVDKVGGLIFAGIKYFLILSVIFYALSAFELFRNFTEKYTKNSSIYPEMLNLGSKVIHIQGAGITPSKEDVSNQNLPERPVFNNQENFYKKSNTVEAI